MILLVAALVGLAWANSPWSEHYVDIWHTHLTIMAGEDGLDMSLHHWVNDGLMVVFFFLIGLEVRREFAIGELTERRRIVVPVVAGIGGMVVPAAIYLALNPSGPEAAGWGAVIGTDTAFLLGVLAIVGPHVSTQLRIFLLTLTVIDDIVAVSVIGIAYTDSIDVMPALIALGALIGLTMLDRLGVWRAGPYVGLVVVAWLATLGSGLHASIAGMLAGLLVPAAEPSRTQVEAAAAQFRAFGQSPLPALQRETRAQLTRAINVNDRLQEALHGWTNLVIVPLFAFANAGVDLRGGVLGEALRSPVTWGICAALVVGKLVGIGGAAWLAVRARLGDLPQGVQWGHTFGGAALSGIGFTVALLIVGLAFDDEVLRREAVVGVLLSVVLATAVGWLVFRVAERRFGQGDAALPRLLSDPVDPSRDHLRGPAGAPLTLVEYLDFECPFCAKATGMARELREHFGDRLRYVVRNLPLAVHPHAEQAALAAEAAGLQGRYWEMHDHLFAHQTELQLEDLVGHASTLGLDVERFLRDLGDPGIAKRITADMASAEASGARGTPTFFVGELRHTGRFDAQALIEALEGAPAYP